MNVCLQMYTVDVCGYMYNSKYLRKGTILGRQHLDINKKVDH